jgi:hypothetical protein
VDVKGFETIPWSFTAAGCLPKAAAGFRSPRRLRRKTKTPRLRSAGF